MGEYWRSKSVFLAHMRERERAALCLHNLHLIMENVCKLKLTEDSK